MKVNTLRAFMHLFRIPFLLIWMPYGQRYVEGLCYFVIQHLGAHLVRKDLHIDRKTGATPSREIIDYGRLL
ncbi:MAG: hypothetical protein H6Q17_403 [Bacteroidetes bacterium]|nr:hypothetical protein [Bacteroidota bacterium]